MGSIVCITEDTVGVWEEYADEHVLLIRTLDIYNRDLYEYVLARKRGIGSVECAHGMIDMKDYLNYPAGRRQLDILAQNFEYKDFDDLVLSDIGVSPADYNEEHGVVMTDDGHIDRVKSSAYIVDMPLVASYIVETFCDNTISMSEEEAVNWVNELAGKNYEFV